MGFDPLALSVYRMRKAAIDAAQQASELTKDQAGILIRTLARRLLRQRGHRTELVRNPDGDGAPAQEE